MKFGRSRGARHDDGPDGGDDAETTVTVRRVTRGRLYARVSTVGDAGDRPFLLVPGIGVSSDYFERLAPVLNRFGPVHALDLPGFAGVPHPGTALTIRQYADLVGAVIDDLALNDPIVVGHSMGTQMVVDLASRRSDLSSIVLIGPVVNANERRILTQAVRFATAAWHEPGRIKSLALGAYALCGVRWFSNILPKMMSYPIERQLPKITADTLVIRGEHDAVSPREWVEQVGALLPSSRLWEIPGAAHSVMHAHADEVAKLSVSHAEVPIGADEGGDLQFYAGASGGDERHDYSASAADVITAFVARVRSTVAAIKGDDRALAEAKTDHAEVMKTAYDRRQAEKSAQPDPPDAE
ncbi:alpha/beta fold hydrolase [Marisediminicola senii]|uniref:alpha/beta fold hydrolase n=1 Tax=Marisediminicola senii TaxID=2711233 RepID=UPI0013EE358C|nr:alpha/beta hydrolase [Marisediminicola senii]